MKDPAILWYWNDWGGGTRALSRFLKGCYMDLLEAQFNSGPLSLEEIKTVLGSDFGQAWPTISKKFKKTETGSFFNERMEVEKSKRKAYTESRRNNRLKKDMNEHMNIISKTYVKHMDNENENINEIKEKGVKGEKQKSSVLDFDYLPEFESLLIEWFEYKKNKKKSYKDSNSRKKFYNRLIRLSNGNIDKATTIIDNSISQNYDGIFELKENQNGISKKNLQQSGYKVNQTTEIPVRHEF